MSNDRFISLIKRLRDLQATSPLPPVAKMEPPIVVRCTLDSPRPWNREEIEKTLNVKLPDQLVDLWNQSSSLRLFEDCTYGQWGLIVWSANKVLMEQKRAEERPRDFLKGDLVIGEFLGDSDLLCLRCNPLDKDFGKVVIALPIDPRPEWYWLDSDLTSFLDQFVDAKGEKYWVIEQS